VRRTPGHAARCPRAAIQSMIAGPWSRSGPASARQGRGAAPARSPPAAAARARHAAAPAGAAAWGTPRSQRNRWQAGARRRHGPAPARAGRRTARPRRVISCAEQSSDDAGPAV
jgi:hypothetical protein